MAYSTDPDVILRAAFSSRHGRRLRDLYHGTHRHRDREHAMLSLARGLAFWTGTNEKLLELLVMRSPLAAVVSMQSKWFSPRRRRWWGLERVVQPAIRSRHTFWNRRGRQTPDAPPHSPDSLDALSTNPPRTATPEAPSYSGVEESGHGPSLECGPPPQFDTPCWFRRAERLALRDAGPGGFASLLDHAKAILYHLSGGQPGAEFTCGRDQLAEALDRSPRHAGRVLRELEKAGVIVRLKTGSNFTKKVSFFAWTGPTTPAAASGRAAIPNTPTTEEMTMIVTEKQNDPTPDAVKRAYRLARAGVLPPNVDALDAGHDLDPDKLRLVAGVCWHLARKQPGNEFDLKAKNISQLLRVSRSICGLYLRRLGELNVVRRFEKKVKSPTKRKRVWVKMWLWFGCPPGPPMADRPPTDNAKVATAA